MAEARTALREREAGIAVLERDGAAVRDALGKAEGWVRDREATIELLRADIRRLQETAAAASLREEELQRIHDRLVGAREEELQRLHDRLVGAREEELQRLHDQLAGVHEEELQRIHDQLAGARDEEMGRIRTQLAGLREAVRQFEREAEQRSAGDAAMRREIVVALEAARRSSEAAAQDAAREAQQSAAALENVERRASEAERKVATLSGQI